MRNVALADLHADSMFYLFCCDYHAFYVRTEKYYVVFSCGVCGTAAMFKAVSCLSVKS